MKRWKSKWKKELAAYIPPLREDVRCAPIVSENGELLTQSKRRFSLAPKQVIALAMCCVFVFSAVLVYLLRPTNVAPPTPTVGQSVVTVQINPSICFVTDEEGNIRSYTALNADADIVLSDEEQAQALIGSSLSNGLVLWVDMVAACGFFSTDNDIRISATMDSVSTAVDEARLAVEAFLSDSGLVASVRTEMLSDEDFCALTGMEAMQNIAEAIESMPRHYTDRLVNMEDIDQLTELYQSIVLGDDAYTQLREAVEHELTRVESILELQDLNQKIEMHTDNPAQIAKDYWSLVAFYPGASTASRALALLIEQMKLALDHYTSAYGQPIENVIELSTLAAACQTIPTEELRALLEDFTAEACASYQPLLAVLFAQDEHLKGLIDRLIPPQTPEEMAEMIKEHMKSSIPTCSEVPSTN